MLWKGSMGSDMENNNLKFEFARMWNGNEIWELKDEFGNQVGSTEISKNDSYYSIFSFNSFVEGGGTHMYEQIKNEAIQRGCRRIIYEWVEIDNNNKHFFDKMITKEGFRLLTEDDIEEIRFKPFMPAYIKEL